MVRNAVKIIALTMFQLNDPNINKLMMDLPFSTFFIHFACYLKDKIVEIDQSYTAIPGCDKDKHRKFDPMFSLMEDFQDLLDYIQEIFDINNRTVSEAMLNALLNYCYLPVVLGSLVCIESKPAISINTSLYILSHTFKNITYAPLVGVIAAGLMLPTLP
jgi:hypothetical protein